jgi:SAM-dependent methyltransferase
MPKNEQNRQKLQLISGAFNHRVMLADSVRTEAYQRAIDAAVEPGMTVMDLGTGTGILAMMAARAGAKRVVAVDVDPIVHLARKIAQSNGFGDDVIEFIENDSRNLSMDGHFDLIITECMGNFFVSDEMAQVIIDAQRFLKPGGRFIPERVELFLAPVFYPQLLEVDFWRQEHYGFNFEPAVDLALNRCYVSHIPGELLLSDPVIFDTIDFHQMKQNLHGKVQMKISKALTIHGFCGWFDAQLTDEERLTTCPGGDTTHWAQTIFPVMPYSLKADDLVVFELSVNHQGDHVGQIKWSGEVVRKSELVHRFAHDTASALL